MDEHQHAPHDAAERCQASPRSVVVGDLIDVLGIPDVGLIGHGQTQPFRRRLHQYRYVPIGRGDLKACRFVQPVQAGHAIQHRDRSAHRRRSTRGTLDLRERAQPQRFAPGASQFSQHLTIRSGRFAEVALHRPVRRRSAALHIERLCDVRPGATRDPQTPCLRRPFSGIRPSSAYRSPVYQVLVICAHAAIIGHPRAERKPTV